MWQQILFWVVTTVISALLAPRPKVQGAKPGEVTDKEVPIAAEGKPIPVLFGTRILSGPNVVWYGDVQITPIKKKSGGKK